MESNEVVLTPVGIVMNQTVVIFKKLYDVHTSKSGHATIGAIEWWIIN